MANNPLTENELLQAQQMHIIQLDLSSSSFGDDVQGLEDLLPCMFHLNHQEDIGMQHMNKVGCNYFDKSGEELGNMGVDFLHQYVHPTVTENIVPNLMRFYQQGDTDAVFSFFQPIRSSENAEWEWLFSTTKIHKKTNTLITLSSFVSEIQDIGHKMSRLLDENAFMKANMKRFLALTRREREIITLVASGLSNKAIADSLFIARDTVEQHRKNINRKLGVNNLAGLLKFAQAFDLV
jgi:DNA-binding CsgD family transcriptional regulator